MDVNEGMVPNPKNNMNNIPQSGVAVTDAPAKAVQTKPHGRKPFKKPNAKKYFNPV